MAVTQGKFGLISVRENARTREVFIGTQCQGGSFRDPPASIVEESLNGPGPVSSSAYQAGWLVAGCMNPTGTGLMVGLGSGAGAVQLLYNFPDIDLTIVEADQAMSHMALRSYPLLDHYQNQGRLHIIINDAERYLTDSANKQNGRFSFILADGYTGKEEVVRTYLPAARLRGKDIFINVIDKPDLILSREICGFFDEWHRPIQYLGRVCAPTLLPYTKAASNWILTTSELDPEKINAFIPFETLEGGSVNFARDCWGVLIDNLKEPKELLAK